MPAGDRLAVAGAIADEYDTRQGIRTVVDGLQDAVVGSLPESWIRTDMFWDFHSKLLNTLENDVGPANIKVRTALELVRSGELTVPGSTPTDEQVERIVAFLLTERGTVTAAAAVIRAGPHALRRRRSATSATSCPRRCWSSTSSRASPTPRASRASAPPHPRHRPCPGDGGCRFWHNIDRLRTGDRRRRALTRPARRGASMRAALAAVLAVLLLPAAAHAERYGTSAGGRALSVERVGDPAAPVTVLVVGSVHGNESAGHAVIRALAPRTPPPGSSSGWCAASTPTASPPARARTPAGST